MNMGFKVNQRSVREKFEKMMKDYEKKEREEKGASGVSVQYSGIHRSFGDVKGRITELNEVQQIESQRKKKEKASAEEMRKKAMEKYSATKKRHTSERNDSDEEVPAPAMKRKSKHNRLSDILADSVQIKRKDSELRQQELELRAEEQRQQRLFQEHLLAQQQQAQQQQHTMNLAMLNTIGELLQKIKNS